MAVSADRVSSHVLRGVLVGLLLAAYFGAWGGAGRTAYVEYVAAPVLQSVAAFAEDAFAVDPRPAARMVILHSENVSLSHIAPAGFPFLLPALFLVVLAPRRRYWMGLWLGHLGLALVGLLLLTVGLTLHSAAFAVYRLTSQYLVDAFSLGIATLAVVREREAGRSST